jgi:hypothetical protein
MEIASRELGPVVGHDDAKREWSAPARLRAE